MKRIITDQKSKIKQKLKSKSKVKLSSKNKVKINKQNQNVKVNIKIGGVDKKEEINRSLSMQPNSIMSYPLFQDAQPPVNIIHNQPRERLVDQNKFKYLYKHLLLYQDKYQTKVVLNRHIV